MKLMINVVFHSILLHVIAILYTKTFLIKVLFDQVSFLQLKKRKENKRRFKLNLK